VATSGGTSGGGGSGLLPGNYYGVGNTDQINLTASSAEQLLTATLTVGTPYASIGVDNATVSVLATGWYAFYMFADLQWTPTALAGPNTLNLALSFTTAIVDALANLNQGLSVVFDQTSVGVQRCQWSSVPLYLTETDSFQVFADCAVAPPAGVLPLIDASTMFLAVERLS
jgi:hypothetical protein